MSKYFDFGMLFFNDLAEKIPTFEADRDAVEGQVSAIVFGHENMIKKHGSTLALDKILAYEVALYFNSIYESTFSVLNKQHDMNIIYNFLMAKVDELQDKDYFEPDEQIVMYPTFIHTVFTNEKGKGYHHVPSLNGYVLSGLDADKIEHKLAVPSEAEQKLNISCISDDYIWINMERISGKIVEKWGFSHNLSEDESTELKEEVLNALIDPFESYTKQDIIEILLDLGHDNIGRIKINKSKISEGVMGNCTGGSGYLEYLISQYVKEEDVKKFIQEHMDSIQVTNIESSPKIINELLGGFMLKYNLDNRKKGEGSMIHWLGEHKLKLASLKHNKKLKPYLEEFIEKQNYFGINIESLVRCSVKDGIPKYQISDAMPIIGGSEKDDIKNISFQTSIPAFSDKDEYMSYIQRHFDFVLENNLLSPQIEDKFLLTLEDKWFKDFSE